MMKKLHLLLVALFLLTFQIVSAQVENDPCSAPCLSFSGSTSGGTPASDGFSPNVNLPCGAGTSEDNPTWYTFVPSGGSFSFSITASGCTGGSGSVQATIFEGDDCGGVTAVACVNCVTGGSVSAGTVPCKQYWIQIDGCAEAVCNFTMTYDPSQLLKTVPAPTIMGPTSVCLGTEQTYCATIAGGCKPSAYTWTTQPAGKAIITPDDESGCATVKWTSAGTFKICAKPKFNVKCPPQTINTGCFDVTVFELKPSNCSITLCPEDLPYDYPLNPCIKQFNPTIPGTPDPADFTISQQPGTTKTYVIPYELNPSGCQGKVNLTAIIKAKAIKSLPPMLLCDGDSIKVGGQYLNCSNAQPGFQNYVVENKPHPTVCDTQFIFILQCIKINPNVLPKNPSLDCINTSVKLNAATSTFLPASTGANPGVKSYLWAASNGGVITGATNLPDITVTKAGTYCVTISYTYTLNTAQGSVTKTCSKVVCTEVKGSGAEPTPPTPIALNPYPCLGDTASYTVSQNVGTTYTWTVTGGTPATGAGPVLKVTWGTTPPFKICAVATNVCGTSLPGCIDVTPNEPPKTPIITGPNPVCQKDSGWYSVPKLNTSGASYTWTVPPGASITSTKKDSNAIKVLWSATAATGDITVIVKDKCGAAAPAKLTVTVNLLPPAATKISGKLKACKNETVTYTVDDVPYATTYKWTVKGGTPTTGTGKSIDIKWTKVAIDNEVCVYATNNCDTIGKKYCITVEVEDFPQPTAGSSKSICGLNTKLNASVLGTGNTGKWIAIAGPGNTVFTDDTNPKTEVDVDKCGEYSYVWTETNSAGCSGKDTVKVTYSVAPVAANPVFSCDPVGKTFKISFDIIGCMSPYIVNGMGSTNVNVNTAPFTFTSNNLPQVGNNVYQFTIQSGSCTTTIKDSVNCNCITKAGDMELQPLINACSKGGKIAAKHKDGTEENDGNDEFGYALYEGTSSAVAKYIAWNKSGEFSFDAATMQCDKSYFIGYGMGNVIVATQLPDITDPCFKFTSINQEVRWDCEPKPNAGVDQNLCGLAAILNATPPPAGTNGKWKANGNGTFASISSPNTTVTIALPAAKYKFTWIENRGACRDSADVYVTFKVSGVEATKVTHTCDAQGENYTAKFDVQKGTPPYKILDCTTNTVIATLSNAPYTFSSGSFKNGDPYCFKVTDSSECDTIKVTGSYACGCLTEAAPFTVKTEVCQNDVIKAFRNAAKDVLDGNDTWEFILAEGSNPKDPAFKIIARNQTGEFPFDAANMQCDKAYQLVYVLGNKTASGVSVKFDDPCLAVIYKDVKYLCVPKPTSAIVALDTCGRKISLTATPPLNGFWKGVDENGKPIPSSKFTPSNTDANAVAEIPAYGKYTFIWTASNSFCKDSSIAVATLNSPSNFTKKDNFECSNTNKFYTLTVDLTGVAPFTLDGAATVTGKFVGNQFISDPIQSGKSVTVSFKDQVSCLPLTYDYDHTCPCESNGGLMDSKQIDKCEGECLEVQAPPNATGVFSDGDDTFEFYLHDGSGAALGTTAQHNKTGKFCFDANNMQFDKLYYISYVVADKKANNEVDLKTLCSKSVSVGTPVIWHANPTAKVGSDETICLGSKSDILIDLTGKASFEIFYKEGSQVAKPLISVNNKYVFPVTPTSTTVYMFTKVTDANGCFVDINKNINITVNQPPKAGAATNGQRLCFGTDKLFTLSNEIVGGDLGGVWSVKPSTSGFDAAAGTFAAKNSAPDTYQFTYTVKGKKPCPDASASFNIIIDPIPVADAGVDKELNCDSREIVLGGNSTKGPNIKYNWISVVPISSTSILNPTVKEAGQFVLEVKDTESSCFSRDTCVVKKDISKVDSASFRIQQPFCFGDDNGYLVVDKVFGGTLPYQYSINNGPFIPYTKFNNLKTGTYFMQVKDNKGCIWTDSVFINQPYEIEVDLGDDQDIDLGQTADLSAQINFPDKELKKLIWYPQCDSCKTLDIVVKPQETTLYAITVINNKGCVAKDNVLVRVKKPRNVFIPNVFFPDSEADDRNRKLKVFLGLDVKIVHYFKIYDRWGNEVYEELEFTREQVYQQNKGWDGRFREERAQPGVYTYSCKVEFVDGYIEIYKGDALLITK